MEIKRITIAGAGTMGRSMAEIFAQKGFDVILWNHREATLMKAKENTDPSVCRRIQFTTDCDAFSDRDLIVENIAENLKIKKDFYRMCCEYASDQCILATNTSGLSINVIAESVSHPERFLGMHWFNPPTLIPLIEIIRGNRTSDTAAKAIHALSLQIGKKPAMIKKDVPGFSANRIQLAVLREVLAQVEEGVVDIESADAVMKYGLGFRWAALGALETADLGGLDIFYHISEYLMPDLADGHEVPAPLKEKFEAGDYGVKTGRGFYDYGGDAAKETIRRRDQTLRKLKETLFGEDA